MRVLDVPKRIRPVKYCRKCSLETTHKKCPRCDGPTIPNPSLSLSRYPRYSKEVEQAIKAAKKPSEELWVRNRPLQGGRGK
jgi:hypothetical protein